MADSDAKAKAAPPVDLDALKDDLGIPAGDTSQDAWLQRRIDGVWAAFESYTGRRLCVPPAQFMDDWGSVALTRPHRNVPPPLAYPASASVFLRYYPVVSVDAIVQSEAAGVSANVVFDAATGKLTSVDGPLWGQWHHDLGGMLLCNRARITYTAGWATTPPDLYEALLGALQQLWAKRAAQVGMGGGLAAARTVTAIDVGTVEFDTGALFLENAARQKSPAGTIDPLLGPWAATLDPYRDIRGWLGSSACPTTTPVLP